MAGNRKDLPLKKTLLVALLLWLLSLIAGAAALFLAEFGVPAWVFVLLLGWLLTFGLPTLSAVLFLARFWGGPSFVAFLAVAVLLGFVFQLAAVSLVRWAIERLRRRS